MAFDDYMEPEVGIAVAVTAAVASPGARKLLRQGAVYGLAGILMAGDAVSSLARGIQRGVKQSHSEVPSADSTETVTVEEIPAAAEHAPSKRSRKSAEAADHE